MFQHQAFTLLVHAEQMLNWIKFGTKFVLGLVIQWFQFCMENPKEIFQSYAGCYLSSLSQSIWSANAFNSLKLKGNPELEIKNKIVVYT